jgi:hypothetical protein
MECHTKPLLMLRDIHMVFNSNGATGMTSRASFQTANGLSFYLHNKMFAVVVLMLRAGPL